MVRSELVHTLATRASGSAEQAAPSSGSRDAICRRSPVVTARKSQLATVRRSRIDKVRVPDLHLLASNFREYPEIYTGYFQLELTRIHLSCDAALRVMGPLSTSRGCQNCRLPSGACWRSLGSSGANKTRRNQIDRRPQAPQSALGLHTASTLITYLQAPPGCRVAPSPGEYRYDLSAPGSPLSAAAPSALPLPKPLIVFPRHSLDPSSRQVSTELRH